MIERRLRRAALAVAVAVSLAWQVKTFLATPPSEDVEDGFTYTVPAQNLAHGHGLVAPDELSYHHGDAGYRAARPEVPDTLRTPGYPALIALILVLGLPLQVVIVLQHLLCVVLTAAVFLLAERLNGRWTTGFAAALVFALFPPLATSAHQYMTEVLMATAVVSTVAVFLVAVKRGAWTWAAAAGLLTGCATLVRPIAVFWFLPLTLILLLRARRLVVAFMVAAIVLPAAWTYRNYAATWFATISSVQGENTLFCRAAGALIVHDAPPGFGWFAMQHQFGMYANVIHLRPKLLERALDDMRHDGIDPQQVSQVVRDRYYGRLGRSIILRHIPETIELGVSGGVEMFVGAYMSATNYPWEPDLPVIAIIGLALGVLAAACYGTIVIARIDPVAGWTIGITIVYFTVLAAEFGVEPRFVVPFAPLYAIAAGTGIDRFVSRVRPRVAKGVAGLRK